MQNNLHKLSQQTLQLHSDISTKNAIIEQQGKLIKELEEKTQGRTNDQTGEN